MRFKMDGFMGKLVRTVTSPKIVAGLGVCLAMMQLYAALDELRKISKDRQA